MSGVWDQLIGGGFKGIGEGLGALAKDIRIAITGQTPLDATKQAELAMQLESFSAAATMAAMEYDRLQLQGQIELLKSDAVSPDKYQSRPRPTVMWICAGGLLYAVLLRPLLPWCVTVGGIILTSVFPDMKTTPVPPLPEIDMASLLALLVPLLGLGTMRSVEKIKGVAK